MPNFQSFCKRNWLSLLGILLGLLGLYVSLYLYEKSQSKGEPIFVSFGKSKLIDFAAFDKADLSISRSNGTELTRDLYRVNFTFWNNGKESIHPSNVLSDITISLMDSTSEIISFTIVDSSRAIPKFELSAIQSDGRINSLLITFKIVEHDDGFVGEVVYAGSPSAPLVISGIVEGGGTIRSEVTTSTLMTLTDFASNSLILILATVALFVVFIPVWYLGHILRKLIRKGIFLLVKQRGRHWYKSMRTIVTRSIVSLTLGIVIAGTTYCTIQDYKSRSTFESIPESIRPAPRSAQARGAFY